MHETVDADYVVACMATDLLEDGLHALRAYGMAQHSFVTLHCMALAWRFVTYYYYDTMEDLE